MKRFESEMVKAQSLARFEQDPLRADYWIGYQRGLRRAHHGEAFGTAEEHETWLSLVHDDLDERRRQLGLGYLDGIKAIVEG